MASKRKTTGEVVTIPAPKSPKKGGIGLAPPPVEPTEPSSDSGDDEPAAPKVKGKRGRKASPPLITVSAEDALKIRNHLKAEIREEGDKTLLLGRDLVKVVDGKLYSTWGHKTFKDYVLSELDFQPRSASSLIAMARVADVIGSARPDADEKIKEIGKVKLMAISGMLTADNLTELHSMAVGSSVRDVQKYAKANRKKEEKKTDVVNRSFKLTTEQESVVKEALDLAASLSDGRSGKDATPGQCLEAMSLLFIATHSGDPAAFAEIAGKIEESLGVQIVIAAEGQLLYGNPANLGSSKPADVAPSAISSSDLDIA